MYITHNYSYSFYLGHNHVCVMIYAKEVVIMLHYEIINCCIFVFNQLNSLHMA